MPFTIGGEWISEDEKSDKNKPIKVRCVKRGKSLLTIIFNLRLDEQALEDLNKKIKRTLGCGGGIKEGNIEIQGDHVERVKKILRDDGFKPQ